MESKKKKRIIISIICLLLLLGAGLGLYIRNMGITAVTMRLQRLVGDVCLYNDEGKSQTLKEKMTLKSGQSLETAGESLVMVSLDEIKLLTLEENSVADIKARGKSLEFDLKEGNLFFNVTEKLSDDQRFDIVTSDMVCGIRGTSAYVGKDMTGHEVLMVTDGIVVVDATNPVTGETIHVEVPAPNMITIYLDDEAEGDATISIKMRKFKEEDLPALALDTIAKNAALRERVRKASGFGDEKLKTLAKLSSRPEVTMFGEAVKELQKEGVEDAIPLMSQPAAEMVDAANKAVDIAKDDLPLEVAIITGLRGVLDVGVGAGYKEASLTDLMVTSSDCVEQVCVTSMESGVSSQELITIVGVVSDAVVETAAEMVQGDASSQDINSAISVSSEVFVKAIEQAVSEGGDALDIVAAVSDKSELVKEMVKNGVSSRETGPALAAAIKEIEELPVALVSKPGTDEAANGNGMGKAVAPATRSAKSGADADGNGTGTANGNGDAAENGNTAGAGAFAGSDSLAKTGTGTTGAGSAGSAGTTAITGTSGDSTSSSSESGGSSSGSGESGSSNAGDGTGSSGGAASGDNGTVSSASGSTGATGTSDGAAGGTGSEATGSAGSAGSEAVGGTGTSTAGNTGSAAGTSEGTAGGAGSETTGSSTSTEQGKTDGSGSTTVGNTSGAGSASAGNPGSSGSESGTSGTGESGSSGSGTSGGSGTTSGSTTPASTPATYTVTFENFDGSELFKKTFEENAVPAYEGNTPSRNASSEYTYSFSGWASAGTNYAANQALPAVTSDVTYTATYSETKRKYGISLSAGTGGTATANIGGAAVTEAFVGDTVYIVAVPDTGYEFTSWSDIQGNTGISASLSSESTSFTMPAGAVSLSAGFKALSYQVTLDPTGGTIKSGRVTSYTYGLGAVLPTNVVRDNYSFKGWFTAPTGGTKVEQISATDTGTRVLYAQWEAVAVNNYVITVNGATNGQVTADKQNAAKNERVTLSVTPASGYAVDAITVKDETGRPLEITEVTKNVSYTFNMPGSAVTVAATFFEAQAGTEYYTVTVSDVFGGTVSLPKNKYTEGENVQFTVNPDVNCYVDAVYKVDSTGARSLLSPTAASESEYFFIMPANDVTLDVFIVLPYTISTDYLAEGGSVKVLSLGNEITTAAGNDTINVLVKPNSGYSLSDVTRIEYLYKDFNGIEDIDYANNTDQANAPNAEGYYSFSFSMPYSDVTIPVGFVSDSTTQYSVSTETSMSHGRLEFDKQSYRAGEIVTITDYPDNGYALDSITVRDMNGNNVQVSDSNTFAMPEGNVTVAAVFVPVFEINIQCDSSAVKDLMFRNATTMDSLPNSAKAGTPVEMSFDINENGDYLFDSIRITDASGNTVPVQYVADETRDSYNPMTQFTTTVHNYIYSFIMPDSAIRLSVNVTPKMCEITSLKVYFEDADGTTTEDTSGTYGSALLDRMTAGFNETVTLSVSPANGYYADSWVIFGNNDHTGGMFTSDSVEIRLDSRYGNSQSVVVVFKELPTAKFGISTDSEFLAIDKTQAAVGETVTVTVSPNTGYYCKYIYVYDTSYNLLSTVYDGVMKNGGTVSFEMPASEIELEVIWEELKSVGIASYYAAGGTVTVSDEWAAVGDSVTVSAVANAGYRLERLKYQYTIYQQTGVNGKTGEPIYSSISAEADIQITNGVGSFEMPGSDVSIVATFTTDDTTEYAVQIDGTLEHGSVIAVNENAKEGDLVTLQVSYDSGYALDELIVLDSDGNPVAVNPGTGISNYDEYVFYMPKGGVSVSATFVRMYSITYSDNKEESYIYVSGIREAKAGERVYVSYGDGNTMTYGGNVYETARLREVQISYGQVSETLTPSGRTYSFVMPESDVAVYGVFDYYYPLNIYCEAGGSAVTDPVEALRGGNSTITVTPDAGYVLSSFKHEYAEASDFYSYSKGPRQRAIPARNADGTYTIEWTIEKARGNVIYFEFEKESYSVNIDNGITGGQITTDKSSAQIGDTVEITVTPEGTNALKFLSVTRSNGAVPVSYSGGVYRFTMPAGSVTVSATFVESENATSSSSGTGSLADKLAAKELVTIDSDMTIYEDLTVPSGKALTIADGKTVNISDGVTLTISSGAVLNNYGTINVNGALTNDGTLNNYSDHTINNFGTIVNAGTVVNGDGGSNDGVLRNHEGAVIENEGTIINNEGSTIVNEGTMNGNDPVGDGTIIDENAANEDDKEEAEVFKVTVDGAVTNGEIIITAGTGDSDGSTSTGTDDGEIVISANTDNGEIPYLEVPKGAAVTLKAVPTEGYKLSEDSLKVASDNEETIELSFDEEKGLWSFVMPGCDVEVKAEFVEEAVDEKDNPEESGLSDASKKADKDGKSDEAKNGSQTDKDGKSDETKNDQQSDKDGKADEGKDGKQTDKDGMSGEVKNDNQTGKVEGSENGADTSTGNVEDNADSDRTSAGQSESLQNGQGDENFNGDVYPSSDSAPVNQGNNDSLLNAGNNGQNDSRDYEEGCSPDEDGSDSNSKDESSSSDENDGSASTTNGVDSALPESNEDATSPGSEGEYEPESDQNNETTEG